MKLLMTTDDRWIGLTFTSGTHVSSCTHYYAPYFEEVEGAYWFRVVRASVSPGTVN